METVKFFTPEDYKLFELYAAKVLAVYENSTVSHLAPSRIELMHSFYFAKAKCAVINSRKHE